MEFSAGLPVSEWVPRYRFCACCGVFAVGSGGSGVSSGVGSGTVGHVETRKVFTRCCHILSHFPATFLLDIGCIDVT